MTIGERIKQLRTDLGMTQAELAKSVGYSSRSTINKIEAGDRKINQDTILLFAKALKTTPGFLMGWEDNPIEPSIDQTKNPSSELTEREKFIKKALSLDEEKFKMINEFLDYWIEKESDP